MPRRVFWTPERLAKAIELSKSGLSYEEIGAAFDKTPGAVSDAMNRHRDRQADPDSYLKGYDGPPIGWTKEDFRLRENARCGSAKLLAEIERVFGRAA